jgi:hypothetical protein
VQGSRHGSGGPATDHAIARGRAGTGLLAHIVCRNTTIICRSIVKPEMFARDGMSLETSTLSG